MSRTGNTRRTSRTSFTSIFEDALARPDLFHWFGVDSQEFDLWLHALPVRVHPGLVSFWDRTGGGEVFESEILLGPLNPDESENVLKVNEHHWSRGLSQDIVLFHTGTFMSASHVIWPKHQNWIVTFRDGTYEIDQRFRTLTDWYNETLRAEFSGRYGLQDFKSTH